VSSLPVASTTFKSAEAAPAQTGRSNNAMNILHHFGTQNYFEARETAPVKSHLLRLSDIPFTTYLHLKFPTLRLFSGGFS